MTTKSHLVACPDDVFLAILEQCEQSSIHQLSMTSKDTRTRCISQLYREIHLSSHNLGRSQEMEYSEWNEAWGNTDDSFRPDGLLSQQRAFLRTIVECPKYSNHVRSFSWTFIWYDEQDEEGLAQIDYQLWDVFSRLQKVVSLDLGALPIDKYLEPYTRQAPSVLFPLVTELRLAGWMPHQLVVNIFNSISWSKLRILSLDALQEEGHLLDGSYVPEYLNQEHWDSAWRATLCRRWMENSISTECDLIFPGPSWVPFKPLIGKLTSLQTLEIRFPPLEFGGTFTTSRTRCAEYQYYISVMRDLIRSPAPSLETLVLDCAREVRRLEPDIQKQGAPLSWLTSYHNGRLEFREVLLRSILPSFSSTEELKWESLRTVIMRGFLQRPLFSEVPVGGTEIQIMKNEIQASLSARGVKLEWTDDSPRPATIFWGHDCDFYVREESIAQFNEYIQLIEQT